MPWPGDTSDQTVVEQVKADLAGWQLNRLVWVFDSGFNSDDNRQVWQRGRSGYIAAERLRSREHDVAQARGRQGGPPQGRRDARGEGDHRRPRGGCRAVHHVPQR